MLGHSLTPAVVAPVASSASHPWAPAATVSNWAAANPAKRRGGSAKHGGAHITCAPSDRNRTASPSTSATSPRDLDADNTRISRYFYSPVLAPAGEYAVRPGSCRKTPGALYVESGKVQLVSFPSTGRSGRATCSQSGAGWPIHRHRRISHWLTDAAAESEVLLSHQQGRLELLESTAISPEFVAVPHEHWAELLTRRHDTAHAGDYTAKELPLQIG